MGLNFYWNKKVVRCIGTWRQRNCHTEDNGPKYRMVGKIIRHTELDSGSINADKRLRNECAMTCYLFPRPVGERVRERGYLAASHLCRLAVFTLAEGATHVARWNNSRKIAFTLAEVLITLGIIGIVAAMTMPVLIQKTKEKETISKLKKFNSVMNQAFTIAKVQNGEVEDWGLQVAGQTAEPDENQQAINKQMTDKVWDILSPNLKITSRCKRTEDDCQGYDRYSLDGTKFGEFIPIAVFADGSVIVGTTVNSPTCEGVQGTSENLKHVCGEIFVDINGPKPPNATGKDVFIFWFTRYGVVPRGLPEETAKMATLCNIKNKHFLNGYACAAWVIYNENMDYLHCDDLSWDGKKSCK